MDLATNLSVLNDTTKMKTRIADVTGVAECY